MTGEAGSAEKPPEPPHLAVAEGAAARPPLSSDRFRWRSTAKWFLGGLLVLDLGVLLFVLSFANVTAEGPAKRSLSHSVAILIEIDAYLDHEIETYLDENFESLQQQAAQADPEEEIPLPDLPNLESLDVSSEAKDIRDTSRSGFRALLLKGVAEQVYEEGVSVFQEDPDADVSFFSTQGLIRTGMDFLRPTPHRVLTILTIALAAAAGVLALGLVLAGRGYGRLLGLGLSVFLAAAPFLIVAVAVRFAFRLAADGLDDYLVREFLKLSQELTWAPIRNGIIFSVGSAVVLVVGTILARWSDSRPRA